MTKLETEAAVVLHKIYQDAITILKAADKSFVMQDIHHVVQHLLNLHYNNSPVVSAPAPTSSVTVING